MNELQLTMVISVAWYSNHKEYLIDASALLESINVRIYENDQLYEFFNDLFKEYLTKFIFESNNIEKEGLGEGETAKLVFDMIEENKLNEALKYLQSQLFNVKYEIIPKQDFNPENLDLEDIDLAVGYRGKKKDINLVMNSFIALMTALEYISDYLKNLVNFLNDEENAKRTVRAVLDSDYYYGCGSRYSKVIRFLKSKSDDGNYLFTEKKIKRLHKILSEGMDNNDNGAPGEYRPEPAHAGDFKTVFLEPSLINKSMKNLIQNHQERFKKVHYNPFTEACKLTGDLNIIHPFGDFNGRIARIILNMILRFELVPFYLILRSRKKDKSKYMTAMKHYYRGQPNTYLALVCKTFIEEVHSINSRLEMANFEPIKPIELSDKRLELINEALNEYKSCSKRF
jgi:fido (protein-threonine AMPylation protein)